MNSSNLFLICKVVPSKSRPGKTDKLPLKPYEFINVCSPEEAAVMTYSEAQGYLNTVCQFMPLGQGESYRIGTYLNGDGRFVVDIDECREGDQWSEKARSVMAMFVGCHMEASQSGNGVHIFGTAANIPDGHKTRWGGRDEFYSNERFICIGHGGEPKWNAADDSVNRFIACYPEINEVVEATTTDVDQREEIYTDAEVAECLAREKSVASIFSGTGLNEWTDYLTNGYPENCDKSSIDLAVASKLAFYSGNVEQVKRIMFNSAMRREKFEGRNGDKYLTRTAVKAVSSCKEFYDPKKLETIANIPDHIVDDNRVWNGVLYRGTANVLFGSEGTGKSYAALSLCAAVSLGGTYLGNWTRKHKTAWVQYEESAMTERLAAFNQHYKCNATVDMDIRPGNILDHDYQAELVSRFTGYGIIVFDTLSAMMGYTDGLDENSNTDMARVVAVLQNIALKTGAAILVIHHSTKNAPTVMRGGSALAGNCATTICLYKTDEEIALEIKKSKYSSLTGRKIGITLEKVTYTPTTPTLPDPSIFEMHQWNDGGNDDFSLGDFDPTQQAVMLVRGHEVSEDAESFGGGTVPMREVVSHIWGLHSSGDKTIFSKSDIIKLLASETQNGVSRWGKRPRIADSDWDIVKSRLGIIMRAYPNNSKQFMLKPEYQSGMGALVDWMNSTRE